MRHANIADAFGFGFDLHDVPPVAHLAPLHFTMRALSPSIASMTVAASRR